MAFRGRPDWRPRPFCGGRFRNQVALYQLALPEARGPKGSCGFHSRNQRAPAILCTPGLLFVLRNRTAAPVVLGLVPGRWSYSVGRRRARLSERQPAGHLPGPARHSVQGCWPAHLTKLEAASVGGLASNHHGKSGHRAWHWSLMLAARLRGQMGSRRLVRRANRESCRSRLAGSISLCRG